MLLDKFFKKKRIFISRHAKSSWDDLSVSDIDRVLNSRGNRDAPKMATMCASKKYVPDCILSSNAIRAQSTASIFANEFYGDSEMIELHPELYLAPSETYLEVCYELDEDIQSVMIFGHNPGITVLANDIENKLGKKHRFITNVPTCGIIVIESKAKTWQDIDLSNCKLVDFLYPKM
ncbi:MAG: histidine phosphatase family protein [Saprospiraceae bacterium]